MDALRLAWHNYALPSNFRNWTFIACPLGLLPPLSRDAVHSAPVQTRLRVLVGSRALLGAVLGAVLGAPPGLTVRMICSLRVLSLRNSSTHCFNVRLLIFRTLTVRSSQSAASPRWK